MTTTPLKTAAVGDLVAPVSPAGEVFLELLARHLPYVREVSAEHDRAGTFPFEVFDLFRREGVLAATVPAELGGIGVSRMHDVALGLMKVAEVDPSTALALHMQLSRGLTLTYEWQHGTPEAQVLAERLMRAVALGEAVICGAVKDAPRSITRLTPAPDGGGWVLNGRKTLVSLAPAATHLVVYSEVHVDGEPIRLAGPVLTRETPGLTVLDNWDGLGMRSSGTVDIAFDNCPVPAQDVLPRATVGARRDAVLAGHTVSSVTMLGIYTGVATAARDLTFASVTGPAAAGAAVRTLVAEIDARLYALRCAAATALRNADDLAYDFSLDPDERGRRMMTPFQCAKLIVNEMAADVVDRCMTVLGGRSYSARHPIARLYRDVRAGRFMQPYTYVDAVDYLSAQALRLDHDNDYVSARAVKARQHQ